MKNQIRPQHPLELIQELEDPQHQEVEAHQLLKVEALLRHRVGDHQHPQVEACQHLLVEDQLRHLEEGYLHPQVEVYQHLLEEGHLHKQVGAFQLLPVEVCLPHQAEDLQLEALAVGRLPHKQVEAHLLVVEPHYQVEELLAK